MRIGLMDATSPRSTHSSNETIYVMATAFRRCGCEVSLISSLKPRGILAPRMHRAVARLLADDKICRDDRVVHTSLSSRHINTAGSNQAVDVVLGLSSMDLAFEISGPSVLWGETRATLTVDKHPYHQRINRRHIGEREKREQAALDKSALIVFPSEWAADVACDRYSLDRGKVRVIPYGVNLPSALTEEDIGECLRRRGSSEWELLFIGEDWKHEGVRVAIDTASILRARGLNVHLTLVDCVPPQAAHVPEYVSTIPRIDRTTLKGQTFLASLYVQSHLLILPGSRKDSTTILSEAGAYGVPSLSTAVGNNGAVVINGVNGQLFPLEAEAIDYADYVLQLLVDPQRYTSLCWGSFKRVQTDLNWDVAVSKVVTEMGKVLQPASEEYACIRAS